MMVTISVHPMELVSEVMKYVMVNAHVGTVLMRITVVSVISEMHMSNCFIIIHFDVKNEYRCAYITN